MAYSPYIIEQTPHGEQEYGIWARLLKDRIIFVGTPLNEHVANLIVAQLLYLEADDPEKPITLYLNSPGGSLNSGLAVYDAIQYVRCEINTLALGYVGSVSALLLAGGTKGKRFGLPNTRVMLNQPYGGAGGTAADIEITTREVQRRKKELAAIFQKHTGQSEETLSRDLDRNFYLGAQEAIEYGIIDEIVEHKEDIQDKAET